MTFIPCPGFTSMWHCWNYYTGRDALFIYFFLSPAMVFVFFIKCSSDRSNFLSCKSLSGVSSILPCLEKHKTKPFKLLHFYYLPIQSGHTPTLTLNSYSIWILEINYFSFRRKIITCFCSCLPSVLASYVQTALILICQFSHIIFIIWNQHSVISKHNLIQHLLSIIHAHFHSNIINHCFYFPYDSQHSDNTNRDQRTRRKEQEKRDAVGKATSPDWTELDLLVSHPHEL